MLIGYDSELLRDVFVSERMAEIFTFERTLQSWLDVEAALARAEARVGVIPQEAADEITRKAVAANLDLDELRAGLRETLHPVVPMVRLLTEACEGDLGGSIHWGATTQDIMDTGMVLQLRDASVLISAELTRIRAAAASLAERYRSAVMPGRTHGQHAVPITFGYKAAVWVDEADRHIEAFARAAEGIRVVQFGGAAGTLASVGSVGISIRHELAKELDLVEPRITWHVSRDRLTTYAYELASAALFVQRIAREVILLQGTDTSELAEPFHMGKVGSSTMPHKRNPVMCETIWSLAALAQDALRSIMTAAPQAHERDMAAWEIEWEAVPRLCVSTHQAFILAADVLEGLHVDVERMRANVDALNGLIMSEATMMRLAPHLGRQDAHDVVYDAAMRAYEENLSMIDLIREDPRLAGLDAAQNLAEPEAVIDAAERLVDDVLGRKA